MHCSNITCALLRLTSMAILMFVQRLVQTDIKAPCHWSLYVETTGDQWIPLNRAITAESISKSSRRQGLWCMQQDISVILTSTPIHFITLQWRVMGVMTSQITSNSTGCSTVLRRISTNISNLHINGPLWVQSSGDRWNPWGPVNSLTKGR